MVESTLSEGERDNMFLHAIFDMQNTEMTRTNTGYYCCVQFALRAKHLKGQQFEGVKLRRKISSLNFFQGRQKETRSLGGAEKESQDEVNRSSVPFDGFSGGCAVAAVHICLPFSPGGERQADHEG